MDEQIGKLLEEQIKTEIRILSTLQPKSDEKKAAIENLAALHKLRIEESKCLIDYEDNQNCLKEQVKTRYFKLGTDIFEVAMPIFFYAAWLSSGFKFEETGTFTSPTFKGMINRFKPTRK